MRILVGNNYLAKTGGTENYTYALAIELKRQGHDVEYFAFERGEVASLLESEGIPFMSADHYDLILANHNTVIEKLWTCGYIIQTCHGSIPALEQPSPFADAYVAVSEEVREHIQGKGFQAAAVIPNGIDCKRFCPRTPVSQTLTTVLSLCQSDIANDFIKNCCEQAGIQFLQSNKFTDNVWSVEDLINKSDLVIGLGRSAYDAMACGRCVLVYDYREYMGEFLGDGMLTPDNIDKSMTCNCSGRAGRIHYDEHSFIQEMQKYSPKLAAWSREFAFGNFNIEQAAAKYLSICRGMEYGQEYNSLKLRLNNVIEETRKEKEAAIDANRQQAEQMAACQHQMSSLQAAYMAKGRKHLRAIRLLLWLNAGLILLLAALLVKYYYMTS